MVQDARSQRASLFLDLTSMYPEEVHMFARRWVVRRVGSEGWGLQIRDDAGFLHKVRPVDEEKGDSMAQVRGYFACVGRPADVLVEPGRVFVKMPEVED